MNKIFILHKEYKVSLQFFQPQTTLTLWNTKKVPSNLSFCWAKLTPIPQKSIEFSLNSWNTFLGKTKMLDQ